MMLKDYRGSQKLEKVKILGRRKVNWGAGEKVAAEMQRNWAQPVRPAASLLAQLGEEYACKAGDPGVIPGSRRSTGEGIGYPFQYSWASLVVQLVKNPPAMRESWVQSLGWEDPLEEETATHSSILAWRIPLTV